MSEETLVPLILCLESANGKDVAVQVEPDDNFETFLEKAKAILGFDININCITNNEPVSMTDSIYHFLVKAEKQLADENERNNQDAQPDDMLTHKVDLKDRTVHNDNVENFIYKLEDGTEVKSSSVQFQNGIAIIGIDDEDESGLKESQCMTQVLDDEQKSSLNYKLIPNNADFASQFSVFLGKQIPTPKNTPDGSDDSCGDANYTRERILDMLRDSPLSIGETVSSNKVRPHNVRKTNPSRISTVKSHESDACVPVKTIDLVSECHSCKKVTTGDDYEIYCHNSLSPADLNSQKMCVDCLDREYVFQSSSIKILETDEFIVVKNKLQMIYKKRTSSPGKRKLEESPISSEEVHTKLAKVGELSFDYDPDTEDLLVEKKCISKETQNLSISSRNSSNVKGMESDSGVDSEMGQLEMLESTQDQVKDFLSMRKEQLKAKNAKEATEEYTCRFCDHTIKHIALAISHSIHHQDVEHQLFPCIICRSVYNKFSDVQSHMKNDHVSENIQPVLKKVAKENKGQGTIEILDEDKDDVTLALQSMFGISDDDAKIGDDSKSDDKEPHVKAEPSELDSVDDDGIWIVQTGSTDVESDEEQLIQALLAENDASELDPEILEQLKTNLLKAIRGENPSIKAQFGDLNAHAEFLVDETFDCYSCRKQFETPLQLTNHKCRARGARRPGRPKKSAQVKRTDTTSKESKIAEPMAKNKETSVKKEERPFDDDEDADPDWNAEEVEDSDHDDEMPPTPPPADAKKELLEEGSNSKCVSSQCEHCSAKFMSKVRLRFHEQFHLLPHSERETIVYECPCCPADEEEQAKDPGSKKKFETEAELFDHLHFGHGKKRLWTCPVTSCRRTFNKKATFAKHMRTHSGVRRYGCEKCGKRFLDKQTLVEHGVTHMKVKPFQCHICLKHMTRRSRLRIHLRAHESELITNSVYCCRYCKRGFRDMYAAQEHVESSDPCYEFEESLANLETDKGAKTSDLKRTDTQESLDKIKLGENGDINDGNKKSEERDGERQVGSPVPKYHRPIPSRLEEDEDMDVSLDEMENKDHTAEEHKLIMLSALSEEVQKLITVARVDKALRCEFCEEVFLEEWALNKHRQIHNGLKNPFICHICKVAFPTYSRVTTHKTTHGYYRRSQADIKREETMFVSGQTEPQTIAIDNDGDEDVENRKPPVTRDAEFPVVKHFLCNTCDKSYLHWTNLQIHRRMKHSSESMLFKCKICDMEFPNSWGVAYHRKKCHGVLSITAKTQEDENALDDNNPNKPFVRFSYSCKDCNQVVKNKLALYKHRRIVHGEVMLRIDTKNGFYTCGECGKKFGTKVGIEGHIKNKHKNIHNVQVMGSHICPQCGKKYAHASGLYTHIKRIHEQCANHRCPVCELAFFSRYELDAHHRKHNDERPYLCDICGQAFRTSSVRNEHQRIHSDIRPHECKTCGMAFRRSGALKNHQLIHTGDKKFFCPRCPKRFRIRSDLKTHLKIKHPGQTGQLLVLEITGSHPNPQQILEQLVLNNIPPEKVVVMTEVGVHKGLNIPSTISIGEISGAGPSTLVFDEHGAAALVAEGGTHYSTQSLEEEEDEPPPRRGRGIGRGPRRPRGSAKLSYSSNNSDRYDRAHHMLQSADAIDSPLLHHAESILMDVNGYEIKPDPESEMLSGAEDDQPEVVMDEEGHPCIVDQHGNLHLISQDNLLYTHDGLIIRNDEDSNVINLEGGAIIRWDEHGRTVIEHLDQVQMNQLDD